MLKKSVFLIAGLLMVGEAFAAEGKVLYSSQRTAMYKYAFPEGQSQIAETEKGEHRWMTIKLKGDAWAGAGLGVDKQRLGKYLAEGALQITVAGTNGDEAFDVGFVMAKGLSAEDLAYQILLPLNKYGSVTKKWSKIIIPLKDFPDTGSRWLESEQRNATGEFKWDRVSEFVLSRAPGTEPWMQVAIADVRIIPAFDASAVSAAKDAANSAAPSAAMVSGLVSMFDGKEFSSEGGGVYTYPNTAKYSVGATGLDVNLIGTAWSGGGVYRAPMNLTNLKAKGTLEFTATGAAGKEVIFVGLVDKANGAAVRVSINPYLPGGLKAGSPSTVSIPLADFPPDGAKWDEATQKNLTFKFDWTQVAEVLFDNNGPNNGNDKFTINKIEIKP